MLTSERGVVTRADRAAHRMVGKPIAHVIALADRRNWRLGPHRRREAADRARYRSPL